MKHKIIASFAFIIMFGFSCVSFAAGPTWDSMSASWIVSGKIESGSTSYDLKGFQLKATKSLDKMFFARIAANNIGVDVPTGTADVSFQQFGVGAHYSIMPALDLWGALNYDRMGFAGQVGTGPGLEVGARWQTMPALELAVHYKYSNNLDFDVADGKLTGYELSAVYEVSPKIGIGVSWSNYSTEIKSPINTKYDYKNIIGLGVRLAY